MPLCIFTIVARNYLPLAFTLADSVRRHHPEADLRIFVADGTQGLPPLQTAHTLVSLDDYLEAGFEELRFKYNITEFCTSVKAHLFHRLLHETDAELVFYLDPDTWLFSRLDVIHEAAPEASVYLTPHLLHCREQPDHAYPEDKHLWEGIFNLGFCAVRRTPATSGFLAWWDRRLRNHCFADHFEGLHTDQKWMDYAPVYLGQALCIVRQQGVNLAHWNLDERTLTQDDSGYTVNGEPLVLFHFSGFDFKTGLLTRHVSAESQQRYLGSAATALASSYRTAVHGNGYAAHIGLSYRYNRFDNGTPVTALHRRLYRALGGAAFDAQPFSAAGPLLGRLRQHGLLDASAAALKDHAAATLPGLGRLTRAAHGLLRLFLRIFGASRYAYLLKFFYKFARPEEHVFLLNKGTTADAARQRTAAP